MGRLIDLPINEIGYVHYQGYRLNINVAHAFEKVRNGEYSYTGARSVNGQLVHHFLKLGK